jgi:ATP-dependent RNA helicase DDX23/PRP28
LFICFNFRRYDQDNEKEKSGKVVFQQDVKRRREEDDTIHWSKKRIEEMTGRDWRIFREDNDVVIKGGRVPNPIRSWNESNLPNYLLDAIKKSNYKKPMQIQIQAIPMGLLRMDIIGVAPTGSGKSCAFLVPLIHYLHNLPPIEQSNMQDGTKYTQSTIHFHSGPYALIMTPTRELAIQINEEFIKLACYTKLTSAVVVGGVKKTRTLVIISLEEC